MCRRWISRAWKCVAFVVSDPLWPDGLKPIFLPDTYDPMKMSYPSQNVCTHADEHNFNNESTTMCKSIHCFLNTHAWTPLLYLQRSRAGGERGKEMCTLHIYTPSACDEDHWAIWSINSPMELLAEYVCGEILLGDLMHLFSESIFMSSINSTAIHN